MRLVQATIPAGNRGGVLYELDGEGIHDTVIDRAAGGTVAVPVLFTALEQVGSASNRSDGGFRPPVGA